MASHYRIALIPGDGIGTEVLPPACAVLDAVGRRHGIELAYDEFDWSCRRYQEKGAMMPDDGIAQLKHHDAVLLGAVGWPGVPDHVSLWGLLIPIRREFRQYVNLRPIKVLEGVPSPAASASRPPPISTRSATSPRCSSPCTARRPTSPGRVSPTRWARSGRPR
jgi:tartrate dehydrogenase/decarboxylase/D-malate dehydrogenase